MVLRRGEPEDGEARTQRRGDSAGVARSRVSGDGGRDLPKARDQPADVLPVEEEGCRAGSERAAGAQAAARGEREAEALVADLSLDRHVLQENYPQATDITRAYFFNDFDVLAVSMQPVTRSWADFRYALAAQLVPRDDQPTRIAQSQVVPLKRKRPVFPSGQPVNDSRR